MVNMTTRIMRIDWIHPSCRDLVIEELAREHDLQSKFLGSMSLQGIKLAISDSGGATGDRHMPLMNYRGNWDLLTNRCLKVVASGTQDDITDLLTALTSAATNTTDSERKSYLCEAIASVCETARNKWDSNSSSLSTEDLTAYCDASILLTPLASIPKLDSSWKFHLDAMEEAVEHAENNDVLNPRPLHKWVAFTTAVHNNEPRFLRTVGFPGKLAADINRLIAVIDSELEIELDDDSADDYNAEAERLESLKSAIDSLIKLLPWEVEETGHDEYDPNAIPAELTDLRTQLIKYSGKLRNKAKDLSKTAAELTGPEPGHDDNGHGRSEDYFDVDGLFSDL
jgi:hypothetical protein